MPRYFLEITFDGSAYCGWQRQPHAPSVQAEVERALRMLLHQKKIDAVGCGRTDTGVHATQFFLHFDLGEARLLGERFVNSLNAILPEAIAARRVIPVSEDAHARFAASERGYAYLIHRTKDPFLDGRSFLLRPVLDVDAMNDACAALLGEQDFSSFQKSGSDNRTSICTVQDAGWRHTPSGYRFTITADRFLRNMVRAIVGTCVRIGKGQEPVTHMARVIAGRDRGLAGRSAAACGLYLERVVYPFLHLQQDEPEIVDRG